MAEKGNTSTVLTVNTYALSVRLAMPLLFNLIIGLFIDSHNISISNNSNCINYRHFANMKGTVYGNGSAKGYASAERLGPSAVDRYRRYRGVYSLHLQGDL